MTGRAGTPSDLATVTAWWRTLGGDGFLVLPPPTRSRELQEDGHVEAAGLLAQRAPDDGGSFAYWHWPSHKAAFDRSGALTGELLLHWGGDHAAVAAGLGAGPEGYRVIDAGPGQAFRLDLVTRRDASGLPDPEDPAGVRQFLDRLGTPLDSSRRRPRYGPLTDAEAGWLHDRLGGPVELAAAARFAAALERRDALTVDETSRLLESWRADYEGRATEWPGWPTVLRALLRHKHPDAWEAAAAVGYRAAAVVADVPSERGLALVRGQALAGDLGAIVHWLSLHHAVREPDWVQAAAALAAELTAPDAPQGALRPLALALGTLVTDEWRETSGVDHHGSRAFTSLAGLRFGTDERLPRELRVVIAATAVERLTHVREEARRLGPAYAELTGTTAEDALAAADRFEAARDGLLAGTGPDLTGSEGALGDVWHRYRTLSAADVRWLRDQVADERTGMQGLGFCLELLHSHGEASHDDVEALVPRWKKTLTKQYRTTYTEWRHPLVTLTCLALETGHPVAGELLAWWAKAKPLWKNDLRLLTHLGAPDEAKADELWRFVTGRGHDTGHLMTWVLMRARLDGVHPLLVADRLVGVPEVPDYALARVLLGVADPAQPLWHYSVDAGSRSWWQRAQEVAEDPRLSPESRALGLSVARKHYLIERPERVRPAPTEADVAAARAWLDRHADA
ncbi:hypothetical protein ACGFMM_22720 [Streptomyces sp. NPDC048604]|uniref:hypothetical protein n=1 Tax=Streptomyces sp. NPDC048604 TaxID=3365578 RepID=UPI00371A6FC4